MKVRRVHEGEGGLRTYVVVLDKGDEAIECLTDFARREGLNGAGVTAIGAFRTATLGYFDRETMEYADIPVDEQVEVLSLVGDIAIAGSDPKVHAHVVVGRRDGATRGGHLLRGEVWPTLEAVVTETPGYLERRNDPETGLALIDLDHSG